MRNNHHLDAGLLSALSSSENISDNQDNRDYGLLPVFTNSTIRSEIPERLLQNDAPTLRSSYNKRNLLTRNNSLQENASSPRRGPPLEQNLSRHEYIIFLRHQDTQDRPEQVSDSSTALFQGWNCAEAGQDLRKPLRKSYSWKEKLGTFAIVGLIAGSVLLCAAVGTLAFLWFGSPAIPAWKEITARNWLSKAISICIGVIQQVMMLQLGIVTATLASLALESKDVVISDAASVSTMRATAPSTGAFVLAWQYLCRGAYRSARHASNIFLIFAATVLWCLSQFLLLIILTDVSLRSTAGLASSARLPYSLHYNMPDPQWATTPTSYLQIPRVGAWNRKVSKYASFAEYSEPPYEADGVSDTGVTLRAFLPFGTAQDRERLESYKGRSTVLDARVTCQVPQIKNATVESGISFQGFLTATRNTPRLANITLPDVPNDFDCAISAITDPLSYRLTLQQPGLSLCQLWKGSASDRTGSLGGLFSEFQNPSSMGESDLQGSAYLFLHNTFGTYDDLFQFYRNMSSEIIVAEDSQERAEWLDLIYANGSFVLSASVCYAAFDFADVNVSISSQSNRTESRLEPVFEQDSAPYTFDTLRRAMGQDRNLPIDKRGVLELAKGIWHVAPDGQYAKSQSLSASNFRMATDMAFTSLSMAQNVETDTNSFMTGLLDTSNCSLHNEACIIPEDMHVSSFLVCTDFLLPP